MAQAKFNHSDTKKALTAIKRDIKAIVSTDKKRFEATLDIIKAAQSIAWIDDSSEIKQLQVELAEYLEKVEPTVSKSTFSKIRMVVNGSIKYRANLTETGIEQLETIGDIKAIYDILPKCKKLTLDAAVAAYFDKMEQKKNASKNSTSGKTEGSDDSIGAAEGAANAALNALPEVRELTSDEDLIVAISQSWDKINSALPRLTVQQLQKVLAAMKAAEAVL
jgi:hypothetical protein